MSNDFDKYLAIANHDIQMANDYGQLKSYVASLLYDNDKKVELLQQKESIIKKVRELINYYGITPDQNDDTTCRSILKQFLKILDKEVN